jgi:predicted AAA+ superfamily ATPase
VRKIVKRLLNVRLPRNRSAFLWGPRKVGKTYWLQHSFCQGGEWVIDLLQTDVFAEYASRPALLRERWPNKLTIIDEVQKVPALLDEVQWLIEKKGASFLLTGSSARKVKRGHGNLLGGRAWRFEMGPLSVFEVDGFDLEAAMASGMLPPHFLSPDPLMDLRGYVSDYLKEEIAAEALTQNIPAFAEFLRVAALTNGELLNYTNVARETGVSAKVVRGYFQILEDTLLGFRLAPWTRSRTRRMILTEKFYFFDVGVANYLARRQPAPGSSDFGKSFEHFLLLELLCYKRYKEPELEIRYWRTSTGLEVDFVLGSMEAAIEVKATTKAHAGHATALRALQQDARVKHALVVTLESVPRKLDGGIEVLPWRIFLERLWAGDLV